MMISMILVMLVMSIECIRRISEVLEEEEEVYPDDLLIPTLSDESIASLKTVAAGAFQ